MVINNDKEQKINACCHLVIVRVVVAVLLLTIILILLINNVVDNRHENSSGEVDLFRDTPVRYFGYFNEVSTPYMYVYR